MVRKWIYGCLFGSLLASFGLFACCVPVRLHVTYRPGTVYEGETLQVSDFDVCTETLLGIRKPVKGRPNISAGKGNAFVRVAAAGLTKTCEFSPKKVRSLTAEVHGTCYAGQKLRPEQVSVTAFYDGGEERTLQHVLLPQAPFSSVKKKQNVVFETRAGSVETTVSVEKPVRMKAVYATDVPEGSRFNVHKVSVLLYYKDGTSTQIRDFAVHNRSDLNGVALNYSDFTSGEVIPLFPERITDDTQLYVITPYGVTGLEVHPKKESSLSASYGGTLYQCDALDSSLISITTEKDGRKEDVRNYRYDDPGYIVSDMVITIPTGYGDTSFRVKPVPVRKVRLKVTDAVGGQKVSLSGIVLTYKDGFKKELNPKDVTWLNLPDVWKDGRQTVWFSYHGFDFSAVVDAVPADVAAFRAAGQMEAKTAYDVSEKDLRTLTLICQRVGDHSKAVIADEIALMLNRYEQFGKEGEGLLDYVCHSGYWGDADTISVSIASASVNEDLFLFVKDAVTNGYRVLPEYVTERIFEASVKKKNSSDYEKDMTVITTSEDHDFRFYRSEAEDPSLLYCYDETIYEKVTGQAAPEANPASPAPVEVTESSTEDSGIRVNRP